MDDSIRILVVDDEADIRRIIRILLESRGYRVLEAPNGRLAVETIRKEPDIDLILLDIMMPELSGIEASREIRSISSAPILFLTARTQEQDKLEAYSSGGDDYLAKPFSHGELLMKVDSLLRRYRTLFCSFWPTIGEASFRSRRSMRACGTKNTCPRPTTPLWYIS